MASRTDSLPTDEKIGDLDLVATFDGAMPTGVTVSRQGRVFVNFPKWGDDVQYTVAEVIDGKTVPYPSAEINQTDENNLAGTLVSVQSVVVDPADRLWILDTGMVEFQPVGQRGPKLVCVDLQTNDVIKTITFPEDVALPTTYLNDVRFDLRQETGPVAYITDSSQKGPNGIIVVDLESGESWRRLHDHPTTKAEGIETFLPVVEGRPFVMQQDDGTITHGATMGADGIAISSEGTRLYYCPLGSRHLYSVETAALRDHSLDDKAIVETIYGEGDKGGAADGLESDAEGRIYATNWEHNAITRRDPAGVWETVAHDPRLLWPDTMSIAEDGYLYVTANQLHRQAKYHDGQDQRRKPYSLFRIRIDGTPVRLM